MRTRTNHFLFSRLSIQQRLLLLICGLLLASIIVYGYANYYSLKKATLTIGRERLNTLINQLTLSFGTQVQFAIKAENAAASQKTVVACLKSGGKEFRKETLNELDKLPRDTTWVSIELLNKDLEPVVRWTKSTVRVNVNTKEVISYTKVGPDSGKVGKIYNVNGLIYYPIITTVTDQKHIIGYIIAWIAMHSTQKTLDQFSQIVGISADVYVENTDGSLWSNLIGPLPGAPFEIKNIHELNTLTGRDGRPMIAGAQFIPQTEWLLVIAFSEQNMLKEVFGFVKWIVLIGVALIATGIFAAWVMSRNITKPLNELIVAAEAIAQGNYSLPVVNVAGRTDELAKLADAFNTMREQISNMRQELEAKVRERTAALEEEIKLRKISEESLRISSKRYHQLVDEVKDYAIIMLDENGKVLSWNKGAEQIKGYKEEEILGKASTCFYTEDDIKNNRPQKLLEKAALEGRSEDEGWRIRKDGSKFWANVVFTAIYNDDDKLLGFAKITRDITERRKLEEERRIISLNLEDRIKEVATQTAQLEIINKELEAFSYSVSHDLRTPLRAISGYSVMLKEDYEKKLDVEGNRIIRNIITNAKMMGQLIDDLLSFSRLGKKELVRTQVDMQSLAANVVDALLQHDAENKYHINIGLLPSVEADQVMIKQVLINLVSNAIKYSSKKIAPEIEIGFKNEKNSTIYYVKDNGVGFDMAYAHKLFGVFQRLHSQEEFEGSGVGLALVKRIIDKHRGEIWAEGSEGEGAAFYFGLPKNNINEY